MKLNYLILSLTSLYLLAGCANQPTLINHNKSMILLPIPRQIEYMSGNFNSPTNSENRGIMLDISRDKVPTMETLYNLVDMLLEFKINQFQLYTEHTFAYKNHKTVWENASPMTPEQIRELDIFCKKRFIELVPNQNSFSHIDRWLKHPEYNSLAEVPETPHSLNPENPDSIKLLAELYAELLPNFSSKQFNVGCDETAQLGECGSSNAVSKLRKGRVYLNFLKNTQTG